MRVAPEGTTTWTLRIQKDSKNDEGCCLGAAVTPVTGSRYNNSCYMVIRCYNGEVHDRGKCGSSKSERKVNPGESVRFTLDRATREITAVKIGADGGNYELGVLWSNVSPDAEVVPVASFYSTGSEKEIALDEMEWGDSGGAVAADDDDDAAAWRDAAAQRWEFAPKFVAAKDAGGRLGLSVGAVVMLKDPLVGGEPRGGASGATTTGTVVEIIKPEDADGAAAAEAAAAAAAELLVRVDVEKLGEVVVPVSDVLRVVDADAALGAKKKRGADEGASFAYQPGRVHFRGVQKNLNLKFLDDEAAGWTKHVEAPYSHHLSLIHI